VREVEQLGGARGQRGGFGWCARAGVWGSRCSRARSPHAGSGAPPKPSPLSASTAQLLNLPHDTTPSKSGFYYKQVKKENGEEVPKLPHNPALPPLPRTPFQALSTHSLSSGLTTTKLPHDTTPSKSGFYYKQVKKENGEEEIQLATSVPGCHLCRGPLSRRYPPTLSLPG
jgi:hypothetical protein